MTRWLLGVGLGMMLAMALARTAQGEGGDENGHLTDVTVETFGRLVNVVVSSEVHYLYFEESSGAIRVVLIGPRGALPRARAPLQLLSSDVYLIKRGQRGDSPTQG